MIPKFILLFKEMGKTQREVLDKYLKLSADLFHDGSVLRCKLCEVTITHSRKSNVTQHLTTARHLGLMARRQGRLVQPFIADAIPRQSFGMDLTKMMVDCDIPLYKMRHPSMRAFLEKYTESTIPSESSLRRNCVPALFEELKDSIKEKIKDQFLWVSIDETIDSSKRCVVNMVAGILSEESEKFLLASDFLSVVNASSIVQFYQDTLDLYEVKKTNVLIFTSDAAPYMVCAGKLLVAIYPKTIHVTCIVHGLHRVCETIRLKFDAVNDLIGNVKKIFSKAPLRIRLFRTKFPELSLPPEPIITRWGTWLEAAAYYAINWESLRDVVAELNPDDAVAIGNAQKSFKDDNLKNQLATIHTSFGFVLKKLKELQEGKNDLNEAKDSVEYLKEKFGALSLQSPLLKPIQDKFQAVLEKNIGLLRLLNVHDGNFNGVDYSILELCALKYAPVTSVDCERSFSLFKNFYRDNRHSFDELNLQKYFLLYANNTL